MKREAKGNFLKEIGLFNDCYGLKIFVLKNEEAIKYFKNTALLKKERYFYIFCLDSLFLMTIASHTV